MEGEKNFPVGSIVRGEASGDLYAVGRRGLLHLQTGEFFERAEPGRLCDHFEAVEI